MMTYLFASVSLILLVWGVLNTRRLTSCVKQKRRQVNELHEFLKKMIEGPLPPSITRKETGRPETGVADTLNTLLERWKSLNRSLEESKKKLSEMEEKKRNELQQKVSMQEEIQRSLGDIVSGLAHEINNPLTGIFGHIDLLLLKKNISAEFKDKLAQIQQQAMRIKGIMEKLNQLDPDSTHTKYEIDLANLLDKMLKLVGGKHENQDIRFDKTFTTDPLIVYGNHFSLWQAFDSIMENAIEAIRDNGVKDGKITISIHKSPDNLYALVDIIDNGGGFVNMGKVFDPFYTTKTRSSKKGIGLTIVFNIIQEHLGSILVSNNDTNGATVSVFLPLMESFRGENRPIGG